MRSPWGWPRARGSCATSGSIRPTATKIVRRNVYGWFARVARGSYELTDSGRAALLTWAERN